MSTKIRLARFGRNKTPFYHIVVTDSRNRRDSKFIEKIGTFNPLLDDENKDKIVLKKEEVKEEAKTEEVKEEVKAEEKPAE